MQRIASSLYSKKIGNLILDNLKILCANKNKNKNQIIRSNSTILNSATISKSSKDEDTGSLTKEMALKYLNECGKDSSGNKTLDNRIEDQIKLWKRITEQKDIISIDLCNKYLQICIENELLIDHNEFLKSMPCKADSKTYLLLLRSASEKGNMSAVIDILGQMKEKGFAAGEGVFNVIILCYTIDGGLKGANYVLGTMKSAKIPVTARTNWQILKGLVKYGNESEFKQFLGIIAGPNQQDQEYKELILMMGLSGRHLWLQHIIKYYDRDIGDRNFFTEIYNICVHLVQRKHCESGVYFYVTFLDPVPDASFGNDLLVEMMNSNLPFDDCFKAAEMFLQKNDYSLHNLAYLTLQNESVDDTYRIFKRLDPLRPHYFWPLLTGEQKKYGEAGIVKVLESMALFDVKPDFETLNRYVLAHMNIDSTQEVMEKLARKENNLTRRDIITPLSIHLLLSNKLDEVIKLCEDVKLPLLAEHILKPLSLAWHRTKNAELTGRIVQIICETNTSGVDWTGAFLERTLRRCRESSDTIKLLKLLKVLDEKSMRITSSSCDNLMQFLKNSAAFGQFKMDVEDAVEKLLDISKIDDSRYIHPRDMNIEQMECHLVELEGKNMETRGLLRRLILSHANMSNFERVTELRKLFLSKHYEETAGMKSSLFHALSLAGDVKGARIVFEELKQVHPTFKIDPFKIIDFLTLLVKNDLVGEAFFILKREAKCFKSNNSMDRNCWNLLGACKKPEDTFKLFQILVEKNYCKPTNVILGPILRPYLSNGNLDKLVQMFCFCVEQYNTTPLQLEVLCAVIESKNEQLLQTVVDAIAKVHGQFGAKLGLLSALAEMGSDKPILKILQDRSNLNFNDLKNRCQRWVNEDKLLPLKTLDTANKRLSHFAFDHTITSDAIINVFVNRNDCEGALEYWQEQEDADLFLSDSASLQLVNLLTVSNVEVPERLSSAVKSKSFNK